MANNNQQQHPVHEFAPSQPLLDTWKLWLASEVVTQLMEKFEVSLNLTSICGDLSFIDVESEIFSPVVDSLVEKADSLKASASSTVDVYQLEMILEEFYLKVIFPELHKIGQSLKQKSMKHLQSSLSDDLQHCSPKNLIKFLEDLVEILFLQRQDFEEVKNYHRAIEQGAEKAFTHLSNLPLEFGDMSNALVWQISSRLQVEICQICSQTLFSLIQLCQSYCELSRRSAQMLSKVKVSIQSKTSIEFISLPVFTLLNKVDSDDQRRRIDLWVGHCINYWGKAPITWQQLEAKLLQNIEPVAIHLLSDLQACFREHMKISPEIN